ncbi:MAG: hydantoinase B/oxoprolinase family protein [Candidatus Odyssella sp.]|nr:hydantoinase B/oxoprolinase family protein [Candidatus Odyssella sp.]
MTTLSKSELITAEIVRNYLETVCNEISKVVENTSISSIFSETHDYSVGIFAADARGVSLLARAQSVPVHIFAALTSVETVLKIYEGDIHEGDLFFASDPFYGGSHIPDWTVVNPVFIDGKPMFFTSVRGHVNDVGGCAPGGYNTIAREIWHEGFRVPPVKLRERGVPVADIWNLILSNTRTKDDISGDLSAMVGGCVVGERRLRALVEKYGSGTVARCVDYVLDYSETRLRAEISQWPDGVYRGRSVLDHDYAGGGEVPVEATVTVKGSDLTIDLTGSHPQVAGFVNSVATNTISNIYSSLVALAPDIPVNSGYFRPIKVVLPPHSVVNCDPPAPVGHSTVCIGSDIMEAVMKAFEGIAPDLVGSANIDLVNVRVYGTNSRTGRFFVASDITATAMSAGGAKGTDGWGGYAAPFCALRLPSLEMYERQYPYRYMTVEYAIDTAAPGKFRGAPALHYRRRMLDPVRAIVYNQGYTNPMQGYLGGKPGAGNYFVLNEGAPDEVKVTDACYDVAVGRDRVIFAQSGAGGGWGDPFERDPARVLADVEDDYVSIAAAARDYGVFIDPDTRKVDSAATAAARARAFEARRADTARAA